MQCVSYSGLHSSSQLLWIISALMVLAEGSPRASHGVHRASCELNSMRSMSVFRKRKPCGPLTFYELNSIITCTSMQAKALYCADRIIQTGHTGHLNPAYTFPSSGHHTFPFSFVPKGHGYSLLTPSQAHSDPLSHYSNICTSRIRNYHYQTR